MSDVLESKIESDIRKFAMKRGWLCYKWVSPGTRGVPDRIFIRRGAVVFMEVKKADEDATKQQALRHRELRAEGMAVHVVDNVEAACDFLY